MDDIKNKDDLQQSFSYHQDNKTIANEQKYFSENLKIILNLNKNRRNSSVNRRCHCNIIGFVGFVGLVGIVFFVAGMLTLIKIDDKKSRIISSVIMGIGFIIILAVIIMLIIKLYRRKARSDSRDIEDVDLGDQKEEVDNMMVDRSNSVENNEYMENHEEPNSNLRFEVLEKNRTNPTDDIKYMKEHRNERTQKVI